MCCLTVTGLNLGGIHARYGRVLRVLKEKKCSLAKAMTLCGVARNTLRDFIGLCEMKILDKVKYKSIIEEEKGRMGQPSFKTIEMRCRAALSEYKCSLGGTRREGNSFHFIQQTVFIVTDVNEFYFRMY